MLKLTRESIPCSQEQLGVRLGVDRATVQSWETGRRPFTSTSVGQSVAIRQKLLSRHPDDVCELAGLNYWAYWVGEAEHRQRDDTFMTGTSRSWRGIRLLRHLVERLDAGHPLVDLNIHSLWALLAARRGLVHDDRNIGGELFDRGVQLIDEADLSVQSHRELTSVLYSLRMEGFPMGDRRGW